MIIRDGSCEIVLSTVTIESVVMLSFALQRVSVMNCIFWMELYTDALVLSMSLLSFAFSIVLVFTSFFIVRSHK